MPSPPSSSRARLCCCCSGTPTPSTTGRRARDAGRRAHRLGHSVAVHYALAKQVNSFGSITRDIQVYQTPTLLIVNPKRQVTTLTGYTDSLRDRTGDRRSAQVGSRGSGGRPRPARWCGRRSRRLYRWALNSAAMLAEALRRPPGAPARARTHPRGLLHRRGRRRRLRRPRARLARARPRPPRGARSWTPASTPPAAAPRSPPAAPPSRSCAARRCCDAARVGAEEIAARARRALARQAPRRRARRRRAAPRARRGARARAALALAAVQRRTLVAMSGGVDSAVAALLTARAGAEVVGVTLELWSDPENDGERSCCSAQAVRGARALAHAPGAAPPLDRPARGVPRRASSSAGWRATRSGSTPNPCVRCNGSVRLDAMLELAARLGADAAGHRALRARASTGPSRCCAWRATRSRTRATCSPALDSGVARAAALPAGGHDQGRGPRARRARAGLSVARKPDSQDLCFLAGTGLPRFLARHGDGSTRARPARHPRPRGRRARHPPRRARLHDRPAPRPRHRRRPSRSTCSAPTPRQHRHGRPARGADDAHRRRARRDAAPPGAHGRRRAGALPRAPAPLPAGVDPGPGRHAGVEVRLEEPITRAAPGQIACLYEGDVILGYGTVA